MVMGKTEARGSPMEREQTTLRLPVELAEQLRRQAQEMGVSMNALMILALEAGLTVLQEGRSSTHKR